MRQGFSVLAALIGVATAVGCSGTDGAAATESQDESATDRPPATEPPPPAPGSPLPPDLQIDGGPAEGGGGGPAVDPGFRTIWAADAMNRLVTFTSKDPSAVTARPITGLAANDSLLGVDFRPADGKLYALGASSRVYTLDRATGVATVIGTTAFNPALAGTAFGFDFNPVADKMRVHSDTDQNLRLDPTTGSATVDGMLAFTTGDPNQGQSPNLVATAYTNSVSPAPSATELYAIDSTRNLLTKLAAPNDGKVTTVGALGVDVGVTAGFDIWGGASSAAAGVPERKIEAYAALVVAGKTGLYSIDLAAGTATLVGEIGHPTALRGFAMEP